MRTVIGLLGTHTCGRRRRRRQGHRRSVMLFILTIDQSFFSEDCPTGIHWDGKHSSQKKKTIFDAK